jgi:hypothetical protein
MKRVFYLFGLAMLVVGCAVLLSQTKPIEATGTWRVEGVGTPSVWEVVLRTEGPNKVVGAVSSCASTQGAFQEERRPFLLEH